MPEWRIDRVTRLDSFPSLTSSAANRLDVFASAPSGLIHTHWVEGTSTAWPDNPETVPGTLSARPAAISPEEGRLDLLGLSADGSVYHVWRGASHGWLSESLGGWYIGHAPSVAHTTNGLEVLLWDRSGNGAVHVQTPLIAPLFPVEDAPPPAAPKHVPLPGKWGAPAVAVSPGTDKLHVFGVGVDRVLRHAERGADGKWTLKDLKGDCKVQRPAAVAWGKDRLFVAWMAFHGELMYSFRDATASWSPPQILFGGESQLEAPPALAAQGSVLRIVANTGTDPMNMKMVMRQTTDGANWSPKWEAVGGRYRSQPAVHWSGRDFNVLGLGTDWKLWRSYRQDPVPIS